ncbi:MAG: transcription termination/antitermination protein NusA [Erysipelotrichaceae bacterium]|nr:transcription termination/antitermination protein NusA [Erysipelotrichaceae bacterium]
MNVKDLINAIADIKDSRSISNEIIIEALAEGLEKAYRKHISCPDASLRVEVKEDDSIHLYQQRTVVEEVDDDEIELALEDVRETNPDAQLGDVIEEEVSIADFGRSSVTLVKNVMLQKIKEASKQVIYDEYSDKVSDLVWGVVETVEEKFVLVNLGKTLAIMLKNDQIPGERYYDGQRLQVIIKSVNKESKGSQVMVSRSSADLVKRLFENSVPEIYDGTVVVKAVAREAGERSKMAVYSNNVNVDAIGSCIGPRGNRVIAVIDAITDKTNPASHESIDIVEWNANYVEYVKNIMKPANVLAVIPNEETGNLLVVVENDQLSLAIGKRGINAKLAVKLLGRKIDIKTQNAVEAEGIDWYNEMMMFQAKEAARLRQEEVDRARAKAEAEAREAELNKPEESEELPETVNEPAETKPEEIAQPAAEEVKAEASDAEKQTAEETKQTEEEVKEVTKKRKPKLTVKASDYVSKFEEFADAKKSEKQTAVKKKKSTKSREDDEDKLLKEKIESLKKQEYEIKPEYTEEEIDEFNNAEDEHWYDEDVNFDDYDEFYDN